jgi:hypothetical protein
MPKGGGMTRAVCPIKIRSRLGAHLREGGIGDATWLSTSTTAKLQSVAAIVLFLAGTYLDLMQ